MVKRQPKIPTNANEYADQMDSKSSHLPVTDIYNSRSGVSNYYSQINPIDPATPSDNWATKKPRLGFNMDHLNTYIIRPADQLQAALFDRYILKDDSDLYPGREEAQMTMGSLIAKKVGKAPNRIYSPKGYHVKGGAKTTPVVYTDMDRNKAAFEKQQQEGWERITRPDIIRSRTTPDTPEYKARMRRTRDATINTGSHDTIRLGSKV